MGTTPIYKSPYAEPTDTLANWPAMDKAAQERWEAVFSTRNRISGFATAAAGWSISTPNDIDIIGFLAVFRLDVTRTGAAITVPADGNITNALVANFDTARFVFHSYGPMIGYSFGRVAQFYISSNNIWLQACAPGANIATNENFNLVGMGIMLPTAQNIIP